MATWEVIRDEMAGMLADGEPLEDVIAKLEKRKNEMAKPMTEQEYIQSCNTEQLADVFFEYRYANATPRQKLWMSASEKCIKTDIVEWLKKPHTGGESCTDDTDRLQD